MAVIKHIASKNADYGESERYLIFQHNEYTQKPILDDEGHMILRDEYYLDGLNCDPFTFASECQELNSYYHKNKNFNEIKSHHYIISFDPKDREECGQNLVRRTTTKKGKKYFYYHCSTYKRKEGCSSHNISDIKLRKAVLEAIRSQVALIVKADW